MFRTFKDGICDECKNRFFYSIGTPRISLARKNEEVKQNILEWFQSKENLCFKCNPVPEDLKNQAGVILHKEF